MVNEELVETLGGPHLQIGPSHFMRPGSTRSELGRIWKYNIEPFIEDQLFGETDADRALQWTEVQAALLGHAHRRSATAGDPRATARGTRRHL